VLPKVAAIPAKAGIHFADIGECDVAWLDPRFRGNDGRFAGID